MGAPPVSAPFRHRKPAWFQAWSPPRPGNRAATFAPPPPPLAAGVPVAAGEEEQPVAARGVSRGAARAANRLVDSIRTPPLVAVSFLRFASASGAGHGAQLPLDDGHKAVDRRRQQQLARLGRTPGGGRQDTGGRV